MTAPTTDPILWANDATFTSGSRSGDATKDTAMTAGVAAQGFVPGLPFYTDQANQTLNNFALWLTFFAAEAGYAELTGDGSDGDVTVTGGTTTLTRDMYYDDLIVEATGVLDANGYRIFARTVTIAAGGLVHNNGLDGVSGINDPNPGGAGGGTGSIGGGTDGGEARASNAGDPSGAVSEGAGGVGGAGGTAVNAGGAGGAVSTTAALGGWRHGAVHLRDGTRLNGGSGGGGGGSNWATSGGGGGGGGGGVVFISCGSFDNAGTVSANGGDGGTGDAGGGSPNDTAGGGGGGGGLVFLFYRSLLALGTVEAQAGAGGLINGGAAAGSPGAAGTVLQFAR